MKLDCRQTPEEIGRDGANLFRRKSGQEQTLHDRRGRFEAARGHNRPFANNCFSVGYRHGQERIALVTMTFPKKGSRPIEVDAVPLRYVVSVSKVGEAGLFPINIAVQLATGRGRLLRAQGLLTRDRWLDFPDVAPADSYPTLTPGDVAAVVRLARASGWNPEEIGRPFLLEINSAAIRT